MLDSVAQFHPEWSRFVMLADQVDECFDPAGEPFTIIPTDRPSIPHSR
jgi:hypothetical protein